MYSVRDRSKLDRIEINNEKIIRKRKRRKEKGAISYATRGGNSTRPTARVPDFTAGLRENERIRNESLPFREFYGVTPSDDHFREYIAS